MDGLKQRVIGALVLVSLAVIFVPMLFDEPHSERRSTTIQLPEEPPFPEVESPAPVNVQAPSYYIEEEQPEAGASEPETAVSASGGGDRSAAPEREPAPVQSSQAQQPAVSAPEPEPVPAETVKPDAAEYTRSLEGAWVVQLGSFGNAENARRLREEVRKRGYNSHLQEIVRGDQTLIRVFSGPFAEKSEAEKAKQVLDKAFGLNGLVTSGGK